MSVHHQHLLLYGYKLPYSTFDLPHEEYTDTVEPYLYDERDIGDAVIVTDGMSGDYAFIGILQFRSEPSYTTQPSIPITTIEEPTVEQSISLGSLRERFNIIPDVPPQHYLFTHHF